MSEQREMTLAEWCAKLPDCHLANVELKGIDQRIAELEAENQRLREAGSEWVAASWHSDECPDFDGNTQGKCTCGYQALVEALEGE